MPVLLITYDLKKSGHNYSEVFEALREYGRSVRLVLIPDYKTPKIF